jgi:hypothetical protein
MIDAAILDVVLAFGIGVLVGTGELVSRFRDEPSRAVVSRPGLVYITVNGLASVFALYALRTLSPSATPSEQTRLLEILSAGIGAMALFRTALFTVRVAGTDVGVGPVAFLQVMLAALDRAVDRKRARERADRVIKIMNGLTFDQLALALPAFNIALMQNLSKDEAEAISEEVKQINARAMQTEAKVLNLGLLLMNYVGEGVLEEAVLGLRRQLKLPDPYPDHGLSLRSLSFRTSRGFSSSATVSDIDRATSQPAEAPVVANQVVVDSHPPGQEVSPPPGTTAHGTALTDAEERPVDTKDS